MSDQDQAPSHNYAYNPIVANWVQSTSLATQLHAHGAPDEPLHTEPPPDDYYRYPSNQPEHVYNPHADQMTSVQRPRQPSNGAVGTGRPPFRAGIAPSHPASRSTPQLPLGTNRPTVKNLAQKFNTPGTSPPTRARALRPSPPTRSTSDSLAITPTAPRPSVTREASYGPHKFTNLKTRERPQPGPASPASTRRNTNPDRKSIDDQASSATSNSNNRRRPSAAASRKDSYVSQASTTSTQGRRPFFGEVIGEYDAAMPGFGIPVLDTSHSSAPREAEPGTPTREREHDAASVAVTNDSHLSPRSIRSVRSPVDTSHFSPKSSSHSIQSPPIRHRRSPSDSHFQQQPRESPDIRAPRSRSRASRIPVSTRRLSTTSDSSSSNRSYKASSARPPGSYKRAPSQQRSPSGRQELPSIQSKLPATTLPSTSYRDYRERGKSGSKAANASGSLAAVITDTTKDGPPSPRLRNSRDRQLLSRPSSPKLGPSHPDAPVNAQDPKSPGELLSPKRFDPNAAKLFYQVVESNAPESPSREPTPIAIDVMQSAESSHVDGGAELNHHREPLTLRTKDLASPQASAPASATTDFEESPILGMPGGFVTTPPQHDTPRIGTTEENQTTPGRRPSRDVSEEAASRSQKEASGGELPLLQPVAFQPVKSAEKASQVPPSPFAEGLRTLDSEDGGSYFPQSELGSIIGFRESIPIMLGSEAPSPGILQQLETVHERASPRMSMDSHSYRPDPLNISRRQSYGEEDESPVVPRISKRENRQTLGPDDSASNVAMFNPAVWRDELPSMPEMLDKRGGLTFDSEAYSVINKVLNIYSKTPKITPEVAHESRQKIQQVSPLLAQHADWGSKESTEAYLARLLTDANGAEQPRAEERGNQSDQEPPSKDNINAPRPVPTYHELELDPIEPYSGGTAIILPSESRRYSRGSHSSVATTIHDDGGRADNSSGGRARDRSPEGLRLNAATYVPPPPPPKDAAFSPRSRQVSQASQEQAQAGFGPLLPEIRTSEGLGIGLHGGQQQQQQPRQPRQQQHPKRPPIPTCQPPPSPGPTAQAPVGAAPYTPSVYTQQPPSSVFPAAPLPTQPARGGKNNKMCLTPGAPHPNNHGYAVHVEGTGTDSGVARENYRPDPQRLAPPRSARNSKAGSSNDSFTLAGSDRGSFKSEGTGSSDASGINTPMDMSPGMDGACSSKASQASRSPDMARTPELSHHPAAFPDETPEAIERRLRRRFRVLEELHCTEGAYMSDLMVISQIWMATASEAFTPQEQNAIFGSIPDLEVLATQLHTDLKAAVDPIRTDIKEGEKEVTSAELEEAVRVIHAPLPAGEDGSYDTEEGERSDGETGKDADKEEKGLMPNSAQGSTPKEKGTTPREKGTTPGSKGAKGSTPNHAGEYSPNDNPEIFDNCTLDNDDKTSVGYVIRTYLSTIEEIYTKYLLNHDKVNKIIASRSKHQDPAFAGWQLACHEHSKDITDAWDLDSLLVKPVQRLMKYPLLLQSLQDVTPPTHDDYEDIVGARKGIVDINVRINDKKKRLETLRQATKEGKKGKKKGFPGIDIVRALGGKDKLKLVALNEQFVDPVYDEHSQKFGGHFFQIQILINDFEKYREELTSCFVHLNIVALHIVALLEDQQSSHPEVESQWRHHAMALLELRNVLLEDHVS